METVKDCSNCYWQGNYDALGRDVCELCSEKSTAKNPYPRWASYGLFPEGNGSLTATVTEDFSPSDEDVVNHPSHYLKHPSGVECIQITEHMNFCLGNAMKYIWRAGDKHETPLEDLKKAKWYIEREIKRLEQG